MSRYYTTVYKEVEVDIDWDDIPTEDLIEELETRGAGSVEYADGKELIESIYQKRRVGQDFGKELDQLIYYSLGRIA